MREKTLGRYLLGEELGRGGMSVVYRARDPVLDRDVAIKVLHPHLSDRADARARFTREAKAIARLKHRLIVEVFDFSPPDSDEAYIVTELIEGPTLRQFVLEHPLQHSEVAALLMRPIFEALEVAHSHGIIHRDVKPENIMIRPDGTLVLMDFGIAQMVDMETLTATGTMLGSPAHMAPEVVEGARVGHTADIFSAGTVLYWLICGALPFTGPNPAALFRRIVECRFDPVLQRAPKAGRGIARITERCLAQDPADRPQRAGTVADQLSGLLKLAGFKNFQGALRQLIADPEVFQDRLHRQMAPAYYEAARVAHQMGETGRALNFISRLLSLDNQHEEGLRLLKQIERGQRRLYVLLPTLAALLLGGVGWGMWGPSVELFNEDAVGLRASVVRDVGGASSLDMGLIPDINDEDSNYLDEGWDAELDHQLEVDRGVRVVRNRWMRRKRPKKSKISPRIKKILEISSKKEPEKLIPIKFPSLYKSAEIFINGKSYGFIAGNENGKIKLSPGVYKIRFYLKYCQDITKKVRIKPEHSEYTHSFDCDFKPAYIKIKARQTLPVWDAENKIQLGNTRSPIQIPMKSYKKKISLLIGTQESGFDTQNIGLRAGETAEVKNIKIKKNK